MFFSSQLKELCVKYQVFIGKYTAVYTWLKTICEVHNNQIVFSRPFIERKRHCMRKKFLERNLFLQKDHLLLIVKSVRNKAIIPSRNTTGISTILSTEDKIWLYKFLGGRDVWVLSVLLYVKAEKNSAANLGKQENHPLPIWIFCVDVISLWKQHENFFLLFLFLTMP